MKWELMFCKQEIFSETIPVHHVTCQENTAVKANSANPDQMALRSHLIMVNTVCLGCSVLHENTPFDKPSQPISDASGPRAV